MNVPLQWGKAKRLEAVALAIGTDRLSCEEIVAAGGRRRYLSDEEPPKSAPVRSTMCRALSPLHEQILKGQVSVAEGRLTEPSLEESRKAS